jgi:hypothetical protein
VLGGFAFDRFGNYFPNRSFGMYCGASIPRQAFHVFRKPLSHVASSLALPLLRLRLKQRQTFGGHHCLLAGCQVAAL